MFTQALSNGLEEARQGLEIVRKHDELEEMKRRKDSVQRYAQKGQMRSCYVATAVYGSYNCPEVWVLGRYSVYKLAKNAFGRMFIKVYYKLSP